MQLTGELPFEPSDADAKPVAPDYVHEDDEEDWEELEAIINLQDKWVSSQVCSAIMHVTTILVCPSAESVQAHAVSCVLVCTSMAATVFDILHLQAT